MKKKRSSSSISTELQLWTPKKTREPSSSASRKRDLEIVPSSNDSSSFTLPEDWVIEKRKRTCGFLKGNVDTYYHEPQTGKKLRSLISVKRYLTDPGRYEITSSGDIKPKVQIIDAIPLSIAFPRAKHCSKSKSKSNRVPPSSKSRSLMKSLSSKSNDSVVARLRTYNPKHQIKIDRSTPLKLPAGWFIRRIPRLSGQSMGRVDKYYCERATGLVFRSKLDVQRYLADNYLDENKTLSELFKPAGLIKMSRSEDKDANEENAMAIVPHSSNLDSYSSMSDDVPLKNLIRKSDDVPTKDLVNDVPLKDLVGKSDNVPLKDLIQKCENVPLNDHGRNSDEVPLDDQSRMSNDVPLEDCVQESDNVPLKDLVLKLCVARKTYKNSSKSSSSKENEPFSTTKTTNTSSVDVSNQPTKIKWVLSGAGGDGWSPFIRDIKVSESLKKEWTKMFIDIVSQRQLEASISDAQD